MADIEPLFPNMPLPRVAEKPLTLTRRLEDDPWAMEALIQARNGRRAAWIVVCLLIVVVGAQAAAIAIMLPLKQVVPYTVTVDRQTGYVETARGVRLGDLKDDEAVVQSMLAQYVLARETFDPADFADRYQRVVLWSLDAARAAYVDAYKSDRSDSLLATMRPGTTIRTTVKAIDLLTPETARVRFETRRQDANSEPVRTDLQAVITFRFTGQPMRMEDRLMNPLGFQVTAYRRDAEAAPLVETPAPAPTMEAPAADASGLAPADALGPDGGGASVQAPGPTPEPAQ